MYDFVKKNIDDYFLKKLTRRFLFNRGGGMLEGFADYLRGVLRQHQETCDHLLGFPFVEKNLWEFGTDWIQPESPFFINEDANSRKSSKCFSTICFTISRFNS